MVLNLKKLLNSHTFFEDLCQKSILDQSIPLVYEWNIGIFLR